MTYARQLKRKVKSIVARLERAVRKNRIGYFFDEDCDFKITIDRRFKYSGVKVRVAIGEKYAIYVDTTNRRGYSKIFGYLEGAEFSLNISNDISDEIDDYFEDCYTVCR